MKALLLALILNLATLAPGFPPRPVESPTLIRPGLCESFVIVVNYYDLGTNSENYERIEYELPDGTIFAVAQDDKVYTLQSDGSVKVVSIAEANKQGGPCRAAKRLMDAGQML